MASRRILSTAARPLTTAYPAMQAAAASQRRSISAYGYEQAKALVLSKYGEPSDVLRLHGHAISPAHSDKLTLRFLASPLNPADINQIQGRYPSRPTFTTDLGTAEPIAVAGNEGVAEVIALGSGVKTFAKGDWVIMKEPGFGTWRTHAQTDASNLLKIEDKTGLTPVQAGTVSINPCTAYRMLKDIVPLEAGDWFMQNGANGSVGRAAIQLAKLWGYRSINIVRARSTKEETEGLKQELQDLGADVVVTAEELEDKGFGDRVKEWTNGGRDRLSLALNSVGSRSVIHMAKHLAPGGHVVTYGSMSKRPVHLATGLLIFKDIHFDGFWVSKWGKENPAEKKKTVDHVLDLIRQGTFKDTPKDEVKWDFATEQETLLAAVQDTLGGFRSGKSIFVFGDT